MDRRQFIKASAISAATLPAGLPGLADAAQTRETIPVTIRTHEVTGALPHIWSECVGSDRAAITLRESWRQDIDRARAEIGVKQVRFHGIFNDELGVYAPSPQTPATKPNFHTVDEVYDGLVSRGLKPLVELSFMPKQLASGTRSFGFYNGNITPPQSLEAWGAFIKSFGVHLVERYGINTVAGWNFEVWNEPNLPFFWSGNQQQYFDIYKAAAVAIKSIDKRLKVGGPATSQAAWIGDFIGYAAQNNAPVDFLSTHVYPGDNQTKLFGEGVKISQSEVIPRALKTVRQTIDASSFKDLPLYVDEWGADSPAFIAHVITHTMPWCQSMSHWVLSGSYEELGVPDYVLKEGSMGWPLMQRGIPLASYNTYRLMHRLGQQRLAATGPALASRKSNGSLAALVWNLSEVEQPGGIPGRATVRKVNGAPKRILVHLPDLAPGTPLRISYVDQSRGSPLPAWRAMGSPSAPTMAQTEHLRRAAQIAPAELRRLPASRHLAVDLPEEGVALIETA